MERRRIVFKINVVYQIEDEQLSLIPNLLRNIIEEQPDTQFDRAHFSAFADSSLEFEAVYFVLSADYNRYMDIQQAIYLRIFKEFNYLGIGFAYPTQYLYLSNDTNAQKANGFSETEQIFGKKKN